MASKKRHAKQQGQKHSASPLELLIKRKAEAFVKAERAYWEKKQALWSQFTKTDQVLALSMDNPFSEETASTVWGLSDGVAFVRHRAVRGRSGVEFRVLPITLEEWGQKGLIVPLEQGELSLAQAGIRGLGNSSFINCSFNDIHIPYVEFSYLKYGDAGNLPTVERAILDFQLTLMGLQLRRNVGESEQINPEQTIQRLEQIADEFECLLNTDHKEEDLQVFLKQYPFVLHPSAENIPKQKLGEDFVTDFVLIAQSAQGPRYILVELERASHSVLTKDMTLTGPVNHAIKQTCDWDMWLETNKAYIQNKLPGFETPTYLIVIGRAMTMDEDQKSYLRSYNRNWKNTELLTYDDLLTRFRSTIGSLKTTVQRRD